MKTQHNTTTHENTTHNNAWKHTTTPNNKGRFKNKWICQRDDNFAGHF